MLVIAVLSFCLKGKMMGDKLLSHSLSRDRRWAMEKVENGVDSGIEIRGGIFRCLPVVRPQKVK